MEKKLLKIFKELLLNKDSVIKGVLGKSKIYLLELIGLNLGFNFKWNVDKICSKDLDKVVIEDINVDDIGLDNKTKAYINFVNEFKEYNNTNLDEDAWYELLATLMFMITNQDSWNSKKGQKPLSGELQKINSKFTFEQCDYALVVLQATGMITIN